VTVVRGLDLVGLVGLVGSVVGVVGVDVRQVGDIV